MLTTFWSHRWLKNASSRFYSERTFLSSLRKLIKFVMSDLDKKFSFNRHFLMFFRNNDSSKIWHKKRTCFRNTPQGKNVHYMVISCVHFNAMIQTKPHKSVWYPFFSLISRPNLPRIPLNQLSILNSMCVPFFTKTDSKFNKQLLVWISYFGLQYLKVYTEGNNEL